MEKIITESLNISWTDNNLVNTLLTFSVPDSHPRCSDIKEYVLKVGKLEDFDFKDTDLVLIDENLLKYINSSIFKNSYLKVLQANEGALKNLNGVNELLSELSNKDFQRVICIGGGILVNVSAYIAEKLKIDLISFPTSLIAMSDASIGGKVRINDIKEGKYIKHSYKSFYEPNEIILDPSFLEYISPEWIRIGLAEIIKHAIYQSPALVEYLLSDEFDPFNDKKSLFKAVVWTADLKRICLEVDPEESHEGARKILRAAHDISDKLEEESKFTLEHGSAVEKAMLIDLKDDPEKLEKLQSIYSKLGIEL